MNTFFQDLRYGLRVLLSRPGTTAVALLALALGIGANTALFSVLYSVLWKSLPYKESDRLAVVWETKVNEGNLEGVTSPGNFSDWREKNKVFQDIAAFVMSTVNLTGDATPEEVPIQYTTPNLFSILGVRPMLGRDFTAEDGTTDDNRAIILSYGLWKRRYNADRNIAGKSITLNGRKILVAGVMPEGFGWSVKRNTTTKAPELWAAYPITPARRNWYGRYLTAVARLKPGVSVEQAQANMHFVAQQLEKQHPESNSGWSARVVPLRQQLSGSLRKPLLVLTAAVLFVLLIACTNVANLMLSRWITRTREIALRSALGAGRKRILRQMLTESVLLAVLGGATGVIIAVWGTQTLSLLSQRAGIDLGPAVLNLPVLSFALGISIFTGFLFGIVPALVASRWNLTEQLNEGGRGGTGLQMGRLRNILVAVQLSVALVLLAGAALLIQSFWKLTSVDPGFDARQVLTFRVLLPSAKYPQEAQVVNMIQSVTERLRSLKGVKAAGMVNTLPFTGMSSGTSFTIQGRPDPPKDKPRITRVYIVDDGYFRVLQIPLKQGRLFDRPEMQTARRVVLINETLARQYFPGENPVGKKITIDMKEENVPTEIIGVVGDTKNEHLDQPAESAVFWPHPELPERSITIIARTEGEPLALASSAVGVVHEIDQDQPVADIRTFQSWLGDSTAGAQFSTTLLGILAFVALTLAATGIFGVMSHAVVQRTREMGIRMALGARSEDVTVMVLKEGARILLTGSVIGCILTAILTRFMQSMLYETSSLDLLSLSLVTLVLIASGLIACWIPSRRAARVNPIEALRYE